MNMMYVYCCEKSYVAYILSTMDISKTFIMRRLQITCTKYAYIHSFSFPNLTFSAYISYCSLLCPIVSYCITHACGDKTFLSSCSILQYVTAGPYHCPRGIGAMCWVWRSYLANFAYSLLPLFHSEHSRI